MSRWLRALQAAHHVTVANEEIAATKRQEEIATRFDTKRNKRGRIESEGKRKKREEAPFQYKTM